MCWPAWFGKAMTEIEIATGAAIAAQGALHLACKSNKDKQRHSFDGSRYLTCANANAPALQEAYDAMELAVKLLFQAKDREARMIEP